MRTGLRLSGAPRPAGESGGAIRDWSALNRSADKTVKGILIEPEAVPEDKFIEDPNPTLPPGAENESPPDASAPVSDADAVPVELIGSDVERDVAESKPEAPELLPDAGSGAKKTDPSLDDVKPGKKAATKPAAAAKATARAKTAAKKNDPHEPSDKDATKAAGRSPRIAPVTLVFRVGVFCVSGDDFEATGRERKALNSSVGRFRHSEYDEEKWKR